MPKWQCAPIGTEERITEAPLLMTGRKNLGPPQSRLLLLGTVEGSLAWTSSWAGSELGGGAVSAKRAFGVVCGQPEANFLRV